MRKSNHASQKHTNVTRLASPRELLSPNNKGRRHKNRALVILLTGFENVNKFRERAVHVQMIGYLNKLHAAESTCHDSRLK